MERSLVDQIEGLIKLNPVIGDVCFLFQNLKVGIVADLRPEVHQQLTFVDSFVLLLRRRGDFVNDHDKSGVVALDWTGKITGVHAKYRGGQIGFIAISGDVTGGKGYVWNRVNL